MLPVYWCSVSPPFVAVLAARFGFRFETGHFCPEKIYNDYMSRLEIALLGFPLILADGKTMQTDRRKAVALLSYLAVTAKSHTRDHLAALLWPDYEKKSAYAYLRRTIWELNQVLGKGWISIEKDHVALPLSADVRLDTALFEQFMRGDDVAALSQAIELYRGEFLEGFVVADTAPFENWQLQQAEHYRLGFARALEKIVSLLQQAREYDNALAYARRWLALDPLHEPANRALMRLLAQLGDRTGAARQYEACVQLLKTELRVAPQSETAELYRAILQGEIGAEIVGQASTTIPHDRQKGSHLPTWPTPFIGRGHEVAQIKSLLQSPTQRLVTLAGPGGIGKTRLSIQAASESAQDFPEGIFFVNLAAVQSAEAVLPAIAQALDFTFYRDERPRQQILDYLRDKRLLLVLDNLEHLLSAADLVADILANAPAVKLLITSRVRLNIQGEQLYPVKGMHLPEAAELVEWEDPELQAKPYSAVQLFLDRAQRVAPAFALSKANISAILEICRLVQGMPLGIELAASWLELLPPAEIAAEIASSLDFLESSQVDAPERQRSIRAVFDSSWKYLGEAEQATLQSLSVFVGNFSREAAQEVSGTSLRELLGLVNKSWLQQTGEGRFQVHELLRHYVLEILRASPNQWGEAHRRHAAYYTGFVAAQVQKMKTQDQPVGVRALEDEIFSNIKSAWDWLVSEERWAEIVDVFAVGLLQVSSINGTMEEILPWVTAARVKIAASNNAPDQRAIAIINTLEVYIEEGALIKDHQPVERIMATWEFVQQHNLAAQIGIWFFLLASLVKARNLDPDVGKLLEAAVDRLRNKGDQWELGIALLSLSNRWDSYGYDEQILLEAAQVFENLGVWYERAVSAQILCKQAIHQKRPLANVMFYDQQANAFFNKFRPEPRSLGSLLNITGLYFREGKIEEGFAVHHEMHESLLHLGNLRLMGVNAQWESLRAVRYSTFEHALKTRQLSLDLAQKYGVKSDYIWCIFELGDIYRIFGDQQKALPLFEEAYAGFRKLYMILGVGYCHRAFGDLALQTAQFAEALEHYSQYMDYARLDNHAWSMAQAQAKRSLALAFLGNHEQVRQEIKAILIEISDWGEDEIALHALLAEAVCLNNEKKAEQAIECCACILAQPVAWNELKWQAQAILDSAARDLPETIVQAAQQRGKILSLDTLIQRITT